MNEVSRQHESTIEAWEKYSAVNSKYKNFSFNSQVDNGLESEQKSENVSFLYMNEKKGNGDVVSDPQDMSNVFPQFFSIVFNLHIVDNNSEHQQCDVQMITLAFTSIYCKTMDRIVVEDIRDCLEDNHLLSNKQFGFRAGGGTIEQVLLVYSDVLKWVDCGKTVDMVYLDYCKL